jgi:hypothetical protein
MFLFLCIIWHVLEGISNLKVPHVLQKNDGCGQIYFVDHSFDAEMLLMQIVRMPHCL